MGPPPGDSASLDGKFRRCVPKDAENKPHGRILNWLGLTTTLCKIGIFSMCDICFCQEQMFNPDRSSASMQRIKSFNVSDTEEVNKKGL